MIANVATMDVGIARPGMIVARRFRRNTKMMITTSSRGDDERLLAPP